MTVQKKSSEEARLTRLQSLKQSFNNPFRDKAGYKSITINKNVATRACLNENQLFPETVMKELLQETIQEFDPRLYPEPYGESLCKIIAQKNKVTPEQVIIGNGGDRIIDIVTRLALHPNDAAIIIEPTFSMYKHIIKVNNGKIRQFTLTPPPKFSLPVEEIMTSMDSSRDKLLFICSPNNPTGNQYAKENILSLIDAFPGLVILDEAYVEFSDYSLIDLLEKYPNVIILRTFSKLYGLAGLRIGYGLACEEIVKNLKQLLPAYNTNSFAIAMAKNVLKREELIASLTKEVCQERQRVYQKLQQIEGITPYPSQANFILFKIMSPEKKIEIQRKLQYEGILIKDVSNYPLCQDCFRFTICPKQKNESILRLLEKTMRN
jgi:histidinol-phosphate aminotransferase